MVSTTSKALPLIELTFKDPTRKGLSLTLWQFFLKDALPFDHSFRFFFFFLAGPAIIFEILNFDKYKKQACLESRKNNFENQISQTAEHFGC